MLLPTIWAIEKQFKYYTMLLEQVLVVLVMFSWCGRKPLKVS